MKEYFKILLPVILLLIIVSCSPSGSLELAKVGKISITWQEFRPTLYQAKRNYDPYLFESERGEEIKRNLLKEFIDARLLLNLAQNLKIEVTDKEVEAHITTLIGPAQKNDFEKILKEREISYDDWIESQHKKLILTKLIKSEIRSKIKVTEEMMKDHYNEHSDKYKLPEQVHAFHLMVDTQKKAEALLELLKKGANFSEVAKEHSGSPDAVKGGDLGFFAKGQYPSVFDETCFSLKPGRLSDIVASNYGFHIFRVIQKKKPQKVSFKEAQPIIEKQLLIEEEKINLEQWLSQLRLENPISINMENLSKI
jgi:peptidyl-prolyl cis-trans isomerase C